MDLIFMGSPDFAIPSLKKLNKADFIDIKGVVTQPDRRRGRGQKLQPTPVKKTALNLELPVFEESNVNNNKFLQKLKKMNPDVIVVAAFGQKLSSELLNIPDKGCINVHASLLPKYRGASPIHHAVVNGDKKTGVTIMYMEEELDTGDIIAKRSTTIKREETVGELHDRLAALGADLLIDSLKEMDQGQIKKESQDDSKATYAPKLDGDFGKIDWQESAENIYNLVRGVNPWPGAFTYINNDLLKIWWVNIVKENINKKYEPGTVVKAEAEEGLWVQTGKGLIAVDRLQLEGRKKMSAADFLRGYELEVGEKLG